MRVSRVENGVVYLDWSWLTENEDYLRYFALNTLSVSLTIGDRVYDLSRFHGHD